jgi:hypothetical protein
MFDVDTKPELEPIVNMVNSIGLNLIEIIPTPHGFHVFVEAFNPSILEKNGITTSGEDYILPDGKTKFTYREECNTILYAADSKSL